MTTKADPQTQLDERDLESRDLEKMLEDREQARGVKSEATSKYKTLDDLAKAEIEKFDLGDEEIARCGRFRISKSKVAARDVSFSAGATTRLTISPLHPE